MAFTSAFVLLAVVWFMTLFVVLPLRLRSQGETGEVTRGTPASAPADPQLKRRFLVTTIIALPIWALLSAIIIFGGLTVDDIDLFTRFQPLR